MIYVAGGYIVSRLLDENVNDLDIFFRSKNHAEEFEVYYNKNKEKLTEKNFVKKDYGNKYLNNQVYECSVDVSPLDIG